MPSLSEILKDPNYINANDATKQAIFNKYSALDPNFTNANAATQDAIRQRFGVMVAEPPVPTKAPTAPTTLRDIGVAGASGFVGATKSLTDVFGADNVASQALGRASTGLQEMYTPERQREMQYYQAKQQEAAKRGDITGEVGAALEGIKAAPLQGTVQAIGSLVPNLATLLIPGAGEARALQLSRGAINTAIGIMQGTGAVKGAIYEGVKRELMQNGMDETSAARKAEEAQSYLGKNADQILAGAVIGFGVGRYGAEQLLSPGVGGATRKLAAIGTEMGTEAIQGGQEQLAQNIALQRQGFDVPTFQGVAGAATQEGVLGALGAGSVSLVSGRPLKKDVPDAPPVTDAQVPLLLEGKGVFTPVGLPDGSVAMTREDLARYEEEKFKQKYAPQDVERERLRLGYEPFTPKVTSAGTVAMTAEDVKRAEEQDFQRKYAPVPFTPEEIQENILRERAGLPPIEGEFAPVVPRDILEEQRREAKEAKGAKKTKSEIEQLEAEAKKIEAEIQKNTTGKLAGKSLRQALLGKLIPSEVSDISPEKSFGALRAKYRGTTVADMVEDGTLDEWLPPNMRPGSETFDSQDSAEYIKDKVRNKDFKEAEPQITAQILGRELDALEERINELKAPQEGKARLAELSPEEVQAETDRLAREAGYLGQPRAEEVLQPMEPAAEPVVDQAAPVETQAAPEEVAASPVTQYTDANNYLQQLSQMYGQIQQQIQATPDEAPIKQELAVRADQIAQAAFATQRTRDAAASLLSDQQRVDVGLPPVGGAVATTQQAPGASEQLAGPQPSTALSAAETDIIEGQAQEVREPSAPAGIEGRKPGTAVSAGETDIIEGQTRFIDEETIAPAVLQLAAPEQQVLANHYGEEVNSPAFLQKLRDDIATFAIRGAKYVDRAIRDIIRKIHAAVLSAAVILNPAYLGPAYQVAVPQNVTTVEQVLAKVPESVRAKMSPGAQQAYANIMPAIQAELQKSNKLFILTDKPNARLFVFDSNGQPILDKKVLLGLQIGDYYKGNTDVKANRYTPAGLFTMGLRDATRSKGEAITAGDYDFGKVFVLDKAIDGIYSTTLFHSAYLKMSDAQARQRALDKDSAEDSRYSFGCINVDKETYKYLLDNYEQQMDGAKLFIVPDNPDTTMEFLRGKAINAGDITRQYVPEVTKKVTKTVPGTPSASATKTQMAARKEEDQETRERGKYMQAKPGEKGMSKAAVDKAVDGIKSTWKNAPDIEVVQSLSGLPQELQDQAKADKVNPRGVYDPNTKKVWLVADNIPNDAQAAITLAHEALGHFGLRVVLGANFKPMMNQIYEGNKSVRERADAYMEDGLDRETAVEEVLSEMAQEVYDTRVPENKNKLTALQKVMNVVRQFLARIGVPMKSISDAQVLMLIANARRSVVRGGQFVGMEGGKALYSEGMPYNLRKWFGGSKIVNEDGSPMVVYHGTTADISEFKLGKEGGALGNGIYMTPATEFAGSYADKKGGNVMPLYASIKNPLVIDGSVARDPMIEALVKLGVDRAKAEKIVEKAYDDKGYITNEVKSRAVAQGYDGITQFKDGKLSEIVAFNPTQVKSVFNKGEFSPTDKRILYSAKDRIERVAQRMSSKRPEMERDAFSDVDEGLVNRLKDVFFPENKTIVDRINGMRDNFWKKLAQGVADQYRSIKDYTEEGYMLARMSKTIDGALEGLLFNGQVALTDGALDIKQNTKGLVQVMEPVGKEVDRFQIWMALNRDAQLVRQGKIPSVDPKLVERAGELANGKIGGKSRLEVYEQVRKDLNALNRSVLDIARKQGLIDEEAYQIFANDINYIPFYKAMEDGDIQGAATASGLARQEFSKQLKGGEKPFADLMENTLRNWSHILSASMKNKAANVTLDAAMDMGAAYPNLKVGFEWRDGKVYSVKSGEMVGDGKLKAEYTTQKAGMVKTMINGKPAYFEVVDPLLLDSISSIGYMGPKSKFLDVAKDFKNLLQFGVTLSPAFKVRNLFRDSISAMAVSDLKLSPFANVVNGWNASRGDNPAHISALAGGAIFNFGSYYEGDQSRLIKRLLKQGVSPDSILDTDEKIKKGLAAAWRKYQEWGNKSESANRMALYQQMRDRGMSHLEASFYARDLLDFSMQGSWPAFRLVAQVVPFLNARVQGLYKLGRDGVIPTSRVIYNTVTGKPIELTDKQKAQQFGTVTGAVVLASMALYLMFKDDDEFQKREAWDRDNFWWFKLPGMDTAIRVPKPFEIGAFGTMAERTLEQIIDQGAEGKQFEESLRRMLGDTFALNPTPQAIKPLLDLYANKDSFTGAPIETAGMERLSKQERASDTTSPLAKALGGISSVIAGVTGEKTELSPVQIDYAIKAYFGWLGGTITASSHYAVMPFSKGAYPDHNWTETMTLGFVKSLPATQSRYVTEFYQNSKQISQAYADMRHYAELGQAEKVDEILAEKGNEIALSKSYDKAAKDMAKVRQVISSIRADETMSGAEKKEEIDRLKLLIDEIAKQMEDVRRSLKN